MNRPNTPATNRATSHEPKSPKQTWEWNYKLEHLVLLHCMHRAIQYEDLNALIRCFKQQYDITATSEQIMHKVHKLRQQQKDLFEEFGDYPKIDPKTNRVPKDDVDMKLVQEMGEWRLVLRDERDRGG